MRVYVCVYVHVCVRACVGNGTEIDSSSKSYLIPCSYLTDAR